MLDEDDKRELMCAISGLRYAIDSEIDGKISDSQRDSYRVSCFPFQGDMTKSFDRFVDILVQILDK